MPTPIENLITSTAAYLDSAQTQANAAITALSNAAASWNATSWAGITSPTLVGSHAPFAVDDTTLATALAAYKTALDAIVLPGVLPTQPDLSTFTTGKWNETAWTNLKALLTDFTSTITDSDNVDSVVAKLASDTDRLQVAMFAADRERHQQGLRDAFSAANAATGAEGFSHPNCMTTALQLAAQQQYAFNLSQASRNLIEKMLDWAKNNFQFSVQQGISAHNADVDFNIRYAGALVDTYTASLRGELELYREKIAAVIAGLDATIKSYALRLDTFKANAGVDAEYDRNQLAKYDADVRQHHSDVQLLIAANTSNSQNKIAAYKATADASAALAAAASQAVIGKVQ